MYTNVRDAIFTIQPQPVVGPSKVRYTWAEHWVRIPQTFTGQVDGRTHGIAITQQGQVVLFHQADPAVVIYSPEGDFIDAWGDRFPGAHGLTLVHEEGEDFLWLADSKTGEVVKTTLDGRTLLNIQRPALSIYDSPSAPSGQSTAWRKRAWLRRWRWQTFCTIRSSHAPKYIGSRSVERAK